MSNSSLKWDQSIVLEYETRVEPFTSQFVKDLLRPVLEEKDIDNSSDNNNDSPPLLFLDVGCGAGCASLLAAEKGFQVTATDMSDGMVNRTRQRAQDKGLLSSIECVVADGQSLSSTIPMKDHLGEYSYAIAAFSLIFFPDPSKGLTEIYKCLSNGGKVLLTAWGSKEETPAFQIFPDAVLAINPNEADEGKPNRITGSPSVLQSLLEDANFQDIEVIGPVSHDVHVKSAEEYYNRFALTSPKIKGYLASLEPGERKAVKDKVLALAEERGGGNKDGSIAIPSMAYLATGTKRT